MVNGGGVMTWPSGGAAAASVLQRKRLPRTLALALVASSSLSSFAYLRIPSSVGLDRPSSTNTNTFRNYMTRTKPALMTMMTNKNYILKYDYVPDILERRDPYRPGHLELAKRLIEQGKCLYGGPIGNPGMTVPDGALFVFADEESAASFAKEDPYMAAGLITGHTIQEWNVILSKDTGKD
jgi:uncharacterized protein YciI